MIKKRILRKRARERYCAFAIEISNEIEKIEDTTCTDTNRDELLKSFCSFTSDLDELFRLQGIKKQAKTFGQTSVAKNEKIKHWKCAKTKLATLNVKI